MSILHQSCIRCICVSLHLCLSRSTSVAYYLASYFTKKIESKLYEFCETNRGNSECQSAYWENCSCVISPLRVLNKILRNMEFQLVTTIVSIDISSAFDTVDHGILLLEIYHKYMDCSILMSGRNMEAPWTVQFS